MFETTNHHGFLLRVLLFFGVDAGAQVLHVAFQENDRI